MVGPRWDSRPPRGRRGCVHPGIKEESGGMNFHVLLSCLVCGWRLNRCFGRFGHYSFRRQPNAWRSVGGFGHWGLAPWCSGSHTSGVWGLPAPPLSPPLLSGGVWVGGGGGRDGDRPFGSVAAWRWLWLGSGLGLGLWVSLVCRRPGCRRAACTPLPLAARRDVLHSLGAHRGSAPRSSRATRTSGGAGAAAAAPGRGGAASRGPGACGALCWRGHCWGSSDRVPLTRGPLPSRGKPSVVG